MNNETGDKNRLLNSILFIFVLKYVSGLCVLKKLDKNQLLNKVEYIYYNLYFNGSLAKTCF